MVSTSKIETLVETGNAALSLIRDMFEAFPYAELEGDGETLDKFFYALQDVKNELKG